MGQPDGALFEAIESVEGHRAKGRALTIPLSIALHAIAIGAVVIFPLLGSETLPDPTSATARAFFVTPTTPAPPPPPPALPAKTVLHAESKAPARPATVFTAPMEIPDVVSAENQDLGLDAGAPGGVQGGVPGGVVGGIIAGLPEAPAPVTVRVGGSIKEPKVLKHVDPVYPTTAKIARLQGVVVLECTLSPEGRVAGVKVLKGLPILDEAAVQAVKQWVFTPTLLNGVPVSAIMTVNVRFSLWGGAGPTASSADR